MLFPTGPDYYRSTPTPEHMNVKVNTQITIFSSFLIILGLILIFGIWKNKLFDFSSFQNIFMLIFTSISLAYHIFFNRPSKWETQKYTKEIFKKHSLYSLVIFIILAGYRYYLNTKVKSNEEDES